MPDLATRSQREAEFAAGYFLALDRHRARLASYGVDRLEDRPAPEWVADREQIAAALFLLMAPSWFDAHRGMLAGGVDGRGIIRRPGDIASDYEDWAVNYARETAKGIVDTTREIAGRSAGVLVGAAGGGRDGGPGAAGAPIIFPTTPQAVDALRGALTLDDVVSPNRIRRTAATEVTRAISAGESQAARAIERELRVRLQPVWVTELDGRVCPICRPLEGKRIRSQHGTGDVDNYPPAHVNCRCYVDWRVA